jgi:hypothetical protein
MCEGVCLKLIPHDALIKQHYAQEVTVLAILMKKLKILQDAYNVKVKAFPSRV